ncbi:hypothetical protein GMSM_05480 [Geomonas sp. Red276]
MTILYLAMVAAGIGMICWGLPASHRMKAPYDALAALAVLVGVVVGLLGALLTADPGFFKS